MLIEQDIYLKKIIDIIKKKCNNIRIILFGSRSRGICLISDQILDTKIALIKNDLEESTIPFKVDIVDFKNLDEDFKYNIL